MVLSVKVPFPKPEKLKPEIYIFLAPLSIKLMVSQPEDCTDAVCLKPATLL
jgi:hypothetical protein